MTIIFYLQCKVQKYSGKFMISVCLKMKIGGFGNCWLFSKNLFCGHTTPTSITCDWIIHTYGCMWGDRKGRLFRQTLENCCGFTGVAKYRNKKKNLTFLLKTRQLSLRIINTSIFGSRILIDDTKFTSPTVLMQKNFSDLVLNRK